jgi:UDP-N-acetyl-D-mannosaminuronic acid dehydrogenase
LGYVGLTLATAMAEVGLRVAGIERRPEVVEMTNAGKPHFSETGLEEALSRVTKAGRFIAQTEFDKGITCKTYVITVGTPLGPDGKARLDMIEAASRQVAENMPQDALVVLRSTVKIGTAREVVSPILAATGKDFDIAMCPERTLEGRAMQELRELPQIVGADRQAVRDRATAVFRNLTNSVVQVSSLEAAEIVKLVDNTYRDVQFGFANEVARLCDAFGVNGHEVISSGKLGYKRTNVPLPGLVGGPCLEKDPHILFQSAKTRGIDLEITRAGRIVNERQPEETVGFICREMDRRGMPANAPVTVMGMAFKGVPATDDLRGSMSLKVLKALRSARPEASITLYDPVIEPLVLESEIPGYPVVKSLEAALENAAVVVIANNHPDFGSHRPAAMHERMAEQGFIYDYWNHFSNLSTAELGTSYFAVGNAKETTPARTASYFTIDEAREAV